MIPVVQETRIDITGFCVEQTTNSVGDPFLVLR